MVPKNLSLAFTGKIAKKQAPSSLHRVRLAQLPISWVRSDIFKDHVLTGLGHFALSPCPRRKALPPVSSWTIPNVAILVNVSLFWIEKKNRHLIEREYFCDFFQDFIKNRFDL